MKAKLKNQLYLYFFCALMGITAGAVIWCFLKIMTEGMALIWEWMPEQLSVSWYTLAVCTAGGLIIGLFRKMAGDYPEELETVFGKLKKNKTYEYKNMLFMIVAALLPLLFGSSIGPEAGMTGIIVGLCCWAGDNMKFAKNHAKEYSEIGLAVTLSVLFRAPLFGVFTVEEENESAEIPDIRKSSKLLVYGIAIAAGTGIYLLLTEIFGEAMEGIPSFTYIELQKLDYPAMILYVVCGCVLAWFFKITHQGIAGAAAKIPGVFKETLGGLLLGITGSLVPFVMFSGEEQMGELMTEYAAFAPAVLIGIAFLKVLLTNICIQSGLKGGHFFPVIFAGVSMGYGVSLILFGGNAEHVVIAAAVVTASLLGGMMRKPLAVTMLLMICFPVKTAVWIFLAAAVGSRVFTREESVQKN